MLAGLPALESRAAIPDWTQGSESIDRVASSSRPIHLIDALIEQFSARLGAAIMQEIFGG